MAPAGALALVDGVSNYRASVERADLEHVRRTSDAAKLERDGLIAARAALAALANSDAIREARPSECNGMLRRLVASEPRALFAAVTDREGFVVCASRPDAIGVDTSATPDREEFFRNPRFKLGFFGPRRISGVPVLVATAPVWAPAHAEIAEAEQSALGATSTVAGARAGTAIGAIHLSLAARFSPPPDGPQPLGARVLVDGKGSPLRADYDPPSLSWLPGAESWRAKLGSSPASFVREDRGGVERLYGVAPIIDDEVWLLAGAPVQEVRRGSFAAAAASALAPVLMWLAGVFVAYFTIDRLVVRHVVYLSRLARAFGHGRLGLRPRGMERAPDEIARLAEDMSDMAAKLDARQKAIAAAAETNRVLLLEVYHRVKNNLQMIASLLSLESRRATTLEEKATLQRVRARVQSVALVHAMLYGDDDVSRVRLDRLTQRVLGSLDDVCDRAAAGVEITYDLEPALATAEHATPFALFLTEAGSNAIAHARAASGPAAVEASFRLARDGGFTLSIVNDADGQEGEEGPDEDALGRRLMSGFAQQLGARLEVAWQDGRHEVRLIAPPGRAARVAA